MTMKDKAAEPWKALDDGTLPGLTKLAHMLMGQFNAESVLESSDYIFGKSGLAIGKEILTYVEFKEGKIARKEKTKEKEKPPTDEGADHVWEVDFIKEFSKECLMHVNVAYSVNWGRDRKVLRKLSDSGNDPVFIKEMIRKFFFYRNAGYIFKSGTIIDVCHGFVQLVNHVQQKEKTQSQTQKSKTPVGL